MRLYEETSSRLVFTVDGRQYNDAEISKLLLDKDPQIREKAGKEINRVCKENAPLFTMIYNMVIKDKAIEDENAVSNDRFPNVTWPKTSRIRPLTFWRRRCAKTTKTSPTVFTS